MTRVNRSNLLALCSILAAGCADDPAGDLGPTDVGSSDGDLTDAGLVDGSALDAGASDGGCLGSNPGLADTVAVDELGYVTGVRDGPVLRFLGLPYAAPPTGERRFRRPEAPSCLDAPLLADRFGAVCPQYDSAPPSDIIGDEDCLSLNVWTPGLDGQRPVLVWVHGGGHQQGAGSLPFYDGRALAESDAVVVTLNYRLGPFGFLSHPDLPESTNLGMADQIFALEWVAKNIERFGGDPGRVMVFGQSAGSVSVCRLLVSPAARGLFSSVALMSGACVATPRAVAEANARAFAGRVCGRETGVRECLETLGFEAMMAGFEPLESGTNSVGRNLFDGVVDGDLLPDMPRSLIERGEQHPVPVIVGSTREENGRGAPNIQTEAQYEALVRALYGPVLPARIVEQLLATYPASDYPTPRAAYVALTSDVRFTCPARGDALALARGSAPVWRYLYAHVPEQAGPLVRAWGAWHGVELPYLFGTLGLLQLPIGAGDRRVAEAMQRAWTRVAAEDRPEDWPAYEAGAETVLLLDGADTGPLPDPKAALCEALEQLRGF